MKTPVFNLPGSNLYFPSIDLEFQGSNLYCANHRLGISKAPTLSILRHQPQGLQPYIQYRLQPGVLRTPILQGSNPIFQGTDLVSMRLQPTTSLRQNIFGYSSRLPKSSSTGPDNLHLVFIVVSTLRHQSQPFLGRCHHCSSLYPRNISKVTSR